MAETTPKAPAVKKAPAKTTKPSTATEVKAEAKKATPTKAVAKKEAPVAAAEKPVAAKKAPAPRKPAVAKKATVAVNTVSDEQRYRMIAEAAYYRAESGQFKSDPVRNWIEAERDIAILLSDAK